MSIEPKYFDDFLDDHVAQLIDLQLREVSWKFDYDSVKNGVNKHWHVFCGHDEKEIQDFGYEVSVLWSQIKYKFPEYRISEVLTISTTGLKTCLLSRRIMSKNSFSPNLWPFCCL